MDIKTEIFSELDLIEDEILRLRGAETSSKKQAGLEIAILKKENVRLGEARRAAAAKIDGALGILKALK